MAITLSSTGLKSDVPFIATATAIAENYTLTSGYNWLSAGPVTINNGVTVTINNGVVWVVT